jgi:hypothetical protein
MEPAAIAQPSTQRRRGRPFEPGVSGNPKGDVAKTIRGRAAELRAVIVSDLNEALPAIDSVLLDRACILLARSERLHRTKDVDAGIRMTSEARRLLMALRRRIPERAAPAETYAGIGARAQEEASERRARELAEDETLAEETRTSDHASGAVVPSSGEES